MKFILSLSIASTMLGVSKAGGATEDVIWLEAEQFADTGGWSNDTQFVDNMGSVQLLATGLGKPVDDAVSHADIKTSGEYRLWVRCRDWLPSHSPGQFQVVVGGKSSTTTFGKAKDDSWQWIDGGMFELKSGKAEVRLHDLTGWWSRCDAVVLVRGDFIPSNDLKELGEQRLRYRGVSPGRKVMDGYDVVVVGGGPAGLGASIAAARCGVKVALIQDRPVVGGNASSEIEIPPMGYIGNPPDKINVTGIANELFGTQGWHNFANQAHMDRIVKAEKNLSLFLNTRATGAEMKDKRTIDSVLALHVKNGQRYRFKAPLVIDCTGHGWIGYYAGAEYMMGQEAKSQFNESMAPEKPLKRTQGNSLYKAAFRDAKKPVPFDCPEWVYQWKESSDFEPRGSHKRIRRVMRPPTFNIPSRGKGRNPGDDPNGAILHAWWVEYGGMLSTIDDAEKIRDELFRVSLGLWNYAKNHNPKTKAKNQNRELVWLNYVAGTREGRRIVGDYIMTQNDFDKPAPPHDAIAFTDWGIDLHHPEGFWVHGNDCLHVYHGRRVAIAYRTLYSKDITNLFMAGRCHSATQLAFAGTRVIRPMCATGQAAGTAAAIATKYKTTPRGVHDKHLEELQQQLLKDGCYIPGFPSNDPNDLARTSTATASSSVTGAEPANAINGWNRVVGKNRNAWAPDLRKAAPHWLQLKLAKPASINEIHVTFAHNSVDSFVEILSDGKWTRIATINADDQRRYLLRINPVEVAAIRVVVPGKATFGICEIRIYEE